MGRGHASSLLPTRRRRRRKRPRRPPSGLAVEVPARPLAQHRRREGGQPLPNPHPEGELPLPSLVGHLGWAARFARSEAAALSSSHRRMSRDSRPIRGHTARGSRLTLRCTSSSRAVTPTSSHTRYGLQPISATRFDQPAPPLLFSSTCNPRYYRTICVCQIGLSRVRDDSTRTRSSNAAVTRCGARCTVT